MTTSSSSSYTHCPPSPKLTQPPLSLGSQSQRVCLEFALFEIFRSGSKICSFYRLYTKTWWDPTWRVFELPQWALLPSPPAWRCSPPWPGTPSTSAPPSWYWWGTSYHEPEALDTKKFCGIKTGSSAGRVLAWCQTFKRFQTPQNLAKQHQTWSFSLNEDRPVSPWLIKRLSWRRQLTASQLMFDIWVCDQHRNSGIR